MSRHGAREVAFKMLFQIDVGKNDYEMAGLTLKGAQLAAKYKDFAEQLVKGATEHLVDLDLYLEKFTQSWDVKRLAAIDKNILRLAIYELGFDRQTPPQIVINEAVELAKTFGTAESPAFVNAVLDGFYHRVVLEDQAEYRPDDQLKAKYLAELDKAKELEALMLEQTAEEAAAVADNIETPAVPDPRNSSIQEKGYRIVKSTEITEAERIKEESVLEDKKRLFGEGVYLTERDIKRALMNGEIIPADVLDAYKEKPPVEDDSDRPARSFDRKRSDSDRPARSFDRKRSDSDRPARSFDHKRSDSDRSGHNNDR